MNAEQCRMARAALKWSLDDLTKASGVGRATIQRFEAGNDYFASTVTKLREAFLSTGRVEFDGDEWVRVVPPSTEP